MCIPLIFDTAIYIREDLWNVKRWINWINWISHIGSNTCAQVKQLHPMTSARNVSNVAERNAHWPATWSLPVLQVPQRDRQYRRHPTQSSRFLVWCRGSGVGRRLAAPQWERTGQRWTWWHPPSHSELSSPSEREDPSCRRCRHPHPDLEIVPWPETHSETRDTCPTGRYPERTHQTHAHCGRYTHDRRVADGTNQT